MAAQPKKDELVVGVVFPAKKLDRLRSVLQETCEGVKFVLMDLFDPSLTSAQSIAAKYGPMDAILHKLAHEMVFARVNNDLAAAQRLKIMEEFVAAHPQITVVDPIPSVRVLTDRQATCAMLRTLSARLSEDARATFQVPLFHVADSPESFDSLHRGLDEGKISLPLISKSVEACATDRSHHMSVITKNSDLVYAPSPTLYQQFVNHSGRLFKGYVLGDLIQVAERRSLPNLVPGANGVRFNTQETYPTSQDFHANGDGPQTCSDQLSNSNLPPASVALRARTQEAIFELVRAIGQRLRKELHLSLFGFDVIVADDTQELFVIDVNYFPSYKELDDFDQVLRRHIKQQCNH